MWSSVSLNRSQRPDHEAYKTGSGPCACSASWSKGAGASASLCNATPSSHHGTPWPSATEATGSSAQRLRWSDGLICSETHPSAASQGSGPRTNWRRCRRGSPATPRPPARRAGRGRVDTPQRTVTVTAADVALLPARSRATAVSACCPLATFFVFQGSCHGEPVAVPTSAPST